MKAARISFLAYCDLLIPDWVEGETDQEKLNNWIASANEEPMEALRCVNAKFSIAGYLIDELRAKGGE